VKNKSDTAISHSNKKYPNFLSEVKHNLTFNKHVINFYFIFDTFAGKKMLKNMADHFYCVGTSYSMRKYDIETRKIYDW